MNYESNLSFGRKVSEINEAYSKMYSRKRPSRINEAKDVIDDEDVEAELDDVEKEGEEYSRNFDSEKAYNEIKELDRHNRAIQDLEGDGDEGEDAPADGDSTDANSTDDEENTEIDIDKDSELKRMAKDDSVYRDFYFSDNSRGKVRKYPSWLIAAAQAHGKELPKLDADDADATVDNAGTEKDVKKDDVEDVKTDVDTDVGTGVETDVDNGVDQDDGFVGDIDTENGFDAKDDGEGADLSAVGLDADAAGDATDDVEGDDEGIEVELPTDGFSITIKRYDLYGGDNYRRPLDEFIKWVTPKSVSGVKFDSEEEAAEEIRKILKDFMEVEPDGVYIGTVVDNAKLNDIIHGDGTEIMMKADGTPVVHTTGSMKGKPKRVRIDPEAYTISSNNERLTDAAKRIEYFNRKEKKLDCDEYMKD